MSGYWPPERPEVDVCLRCGGESWACICDPSRPRRKSTAAELERARRLRLTRAELETTGGKR